MGNITYNRIDFQIRQQDIAEIKILTEAISAKIPEVGMTPEEYKKFRGIDVNNKVFTQDCIKLLRLNGAAIMPPYINTQDIISDYELFEDLEQIKSLLKDVLGKVETAQRIAGKEVLDHARIVYKQYQIASKSGVPDAKESTKELAKHFDKQKGRKADSIAKRPNKD